MARKSVVEAPPPARQAVVVRAGPPPQGTGKRRDLVIGVVGLLLLVAAGGLVKVLPEKDVLLPQFRVTVIEQQSEQGTGTREGRFLTTGGPDANEEDIFYTIPMDSVHKMVLGVGFEDDRPASFSDTIEFCFYNLEDECMIEAFRVTSGAPVVAPGPPPTYDGNYSNAVKTYQIFPMPQDSIVTGISADETEAEVRSRLMEEYFVPTAGDWRLHARLVSAADCPSLTSDTQRAVACTNEADSQTDPDPGNSYLVEGLTYYYFVLDVQEIE